MPDRNSGACVATDTRVIVKGVGEKPISQVGIDNLIMEFPSWRVKFDSSLVNSQAQASGNNPRECLELDKIRSFSD